jgi:erythromycin esterase-like protein
MNATTFPDLSHDLLVEAVRRNACPLPGAVNDYDPLLDLIGDARFVLIGEASHGTHEFYRERAQITKRLIREKGFNTIAVEADWPDALRVNRYIGARGDDLDAEGALAGFKRFPTWMWRNADVLDFVGWLRNHNDKIKGGMRKVGFYGLDLYSLHASMAAVIAYLEKVDTAAAERARRRYACFEAYGENGQSYGFSAGLHLGASCEQEVITQLVELTRNASSYALRDGRLAEDDYFYAEQNAQLVRDAEEYYRTMYRAEVSSWNLRDKHMARTLESLVEYLDRSGSSTKVVVWAHNSHLGDARATEMGVRGEWNLGQLVRERFGRKSVLVGFTTYHGTVTAASSWDAPAELKEIVPALPESYEALFHQLGVDRFMLTFPGHRVPGMGEPQLERAIGVIYRPETERASHYFYSSLPVQFDAVIHIDRTRGVEPLERTAEWAKQAEVPETFPSGV